MADNSDFKRTQIQIEVCESELDNLSEWERDFVTTASAQFTRTGKLSIKQEQTLGRLYERIA